MISPKENLSNVLHDFLKSIKECGRAGALCFVFRAVCLLVAYVGRIPGPLMWSGGPVSAVDAGTSVPCMWAEVIKVTVLKGGGGGEALLSVYSLSLVSSLCTLRFM